MEAWQYGPAYELGWDDPLPEEEQGLWAELLQTAVEMEPITFMTTVLLQHSTYIRWQVVPPNGPWSIPPDGLIKGPPGGPPSGPWGGPPSGS